MNPGITFVRELVIAVRDGLKTETRRLPSVAHAMLLAGGATVDQLARLPYGVGQRLYVKESFRELPSGDHAYRADVPEAELKAHKWKSGRYMPRRAARMELDVLGFRAERLHEITEAGARAEGVQAVPFYPDDGFPLSTGYMLGANDGRSPLHRTPREAFAAGWDKINGKRASAAWSDNPWVWVISFEVVR
jgi:hypothetical protein